METLQRAFGMLALAIASTLPRERLQQLTEDIRFSTTCDLSTDEMVPMTADKLRERMLIGDVTCITPQPEPFTFIYLSMNGPEGRGTIVLRCVWGMWLEREASWKGKRPVLAKPVLTREEAVAKGIPMPDEHPVILERKTPHE